MLWLLKQYDKALADFTAALRINPDNAHAHNNIGMMLEKMGRSEEAVCHFKKALQIKPGYMDAAKNLREASVKMKK